MNRVGCGGSYGSGTVFSLEYVGHEFLKVLWQCICDTLFYDQKFYTPLPTMLKKHVTSTQVAWKICIFGAISSNKIVSKISGHPIIS